MRRARSRRSVAPRGESTHHHSTRRMRLALPRLPCTPREAPNPSFDSPARTRQSSPPQYLGISQQLSCTPWLLRRRHREPPCRSCIPKSDSASRRSGVSLPPRRSTWHRLIHLLRPRCLEANPLPRRRCHRVAQLLGTIRCRRARWRLASARAREALHPAALRANRLHQRRRRRPTFLHPVTDRRLLVLRRRPLRRGRPKSARSSRRSPVCREWRASTLRVTPIVLAILCPHRWRRRRLPRRCRAVRSTGRLRRTRLARLLGVLAVASGREVARARESDLGVGRGHARPSDARDDRDHHRSSAGTPRIEIAHDHARDYALDRVLVRPSFKSPSLRTWCRSHVARWW